MLMYYGSIFFFFFFFFKGNNSCFENKFANTNCINYINSKQNATNRNGVVKTHLISFKNLYALMKA